jgi:5'(3')-deoxyribonucleotidase
MNKKRTLLIDMDCILVDMLPPWILKYNEATGEAVQVSDVKDYNLTKVCTNIKALDSILHKPGFFYDMEPMPKAVEALQKLMDDGYDIVIVTQPPRRAEYAVRDKRRWIKKYFPDFGLENMIFCHRKDMIMGDLLFDDKPSHLLDWKKANPNGIAATLDWDYNNLPEVNRVVSFRGSQKYGWVDFVEFVHSVLPLG